MHWPFFLINNGSKQRGLCLPRVEEKIKKKEKHKRAIEKKSPTEKLIKSRVSFMRFWGLGKHESLPEQVCTKEQSLRRNGAFETYLSHLNCRCFYLNRNLKWL